MKLADQLLSPPKKIFLIDALGAFLTASILGIVFTNFQEYIGIPTDILISLALIAVVFFIYSMSCFLFMKMKWKPYLKAIAIANLLYCILTVALILTFFHQLTLLGLFYFIGEIIVVLFLIYIELSIVNGK
ncbi:hypothetical protein ABWH96_20500 [Marivirga tractuosa]|uniref:hypothetical protein n=1 Tax=Marivirga tractuosa TaxID=1006 RepID=UPI0035D06400